MPVCITGMHRSGTSMVARLAQQSGVFLGAKADLIPATPDNPAGHWEHVRFVKLNDEILNALGAGWDCPPPSPVDWKRVLSLPRLRRQADLLLEEFSPYGSWGWKDPRTSLTLPFWLALCPNLKVVVCIRNPLEVVASLRQRGLSSYAFGLRLWSIYNRRLAERVDPSHRLVVHYASALAAPQSEVKRMVSFLEIDVDPSVMERASRSARAELRHHRFTTRQLLEAEVAPELLQLYLELCEWAGWSDDVGVLAEARVMREYAPSASRGGPSTTSDNRRPGLDDSREADGQVNAAVVDAVLDSELAARERDSLLSAIADNWSTIRDVESRLDAQRDARQAGQDELDALKDQLEALRADLDSRRHADLELRALLARLAEAVAARDGAWAETLTHVETREQTLAETRARAVQLERELAEAVAIEETLRERTRLDLLAREQIVTDGRVREAALEVALGEAIARAEGVREQAQVEASVSEQRLTDERLRAETLDSAWKEAVAAGEAIREAAQSDAVLREQLLAEERSRVEDLQTALGDRMAAASAARLQARQDLAARDRELAAARSSIRDLEDALATALDDARAHREQFEAGDRRTYEGLKRRVLDAIEKTLPHGATVLVVSRGDDGLLGVAGRKAWHFPRTAEGVWAGHHPADSADAIGCLEALRAAGAGYLVFPETARWWLDHYPELRAHLERRYRLAVNLVDTAIIFDITEPACAEGVDALPRAQRFRR